MIIIFDSFITIFLYTIILPKIMAYPAAMNSLKIKLPSKISQVPQVTSTYDFKVSNTEIKPSRISASPLFPLESIFSFAAKIKNLRSGEEKLSKLAPGATTLTSAVNSNTLSPDNPKHLKDDASKDDAIKAEEQSRPKKFDIDSFPSALEPSSSEMLSTSTTAQSDIKIATHHDIHPVTRNHKNVVKPTISSVLLPPLQNHENDAQKPKTSFLLSLQKQLSSMKKSLTFDNIMKPVALAATSSQKDGLLSGVKPSNKRRRKRKRHRSKSKILGCGNFVCLLQKFELLKTFKNGEQDGYFLETQKHKLSQKDKKCKSFKCWINRFTITKNTDGFLLKFKSSPKAVNINHNSNTSDDWSFHRPLNVSEIFQPKPKSNKNQINQLETTEKTLKITL